MHLSEQQRANALLLAESAAERLVKHAPRFVGEGFSLSEAHLDAVCVQQYILETKKLFDRIASLEGDLRKAAGAPQPGVPEGWSFVREGDRIRVISPGYATVDVLYNTRSQSEMMLYELVDAMLKAQPAEQPTFTVGTDLSDGELTVVVMKHESGVTRRIHEEVFEAVPVSILGSPERIRAGVDELSNRNRAVAAQMADMVVGGAVATEQPGVPAGERKVTNQYHKVDSAALAYIVAVLRDYAHIQEAGLIEPANRYPAADVNQQADAIIDRLRQPAAELEQRPAPAGRTR